MLSVEEIKRFIDDDKTSEKKRFARVGQRYYEADHDILKYRVFYYDADGILREDKIRANNKICHPFFSELSDQLPAYILSGDDNPIQAKEKAEGLQDHLDEYFDEEFWAEAFELILGTHNKGFEYLYGYKNAEDRIAFACADSIGVIEVEARFAEDNQDHVIYWYVDRIDSEGNKIKKIMVWDSEQTYYYIQEDNDSLIKLDDKVELNPRPHVVFTDETGVKQGGGFGYIPFWRLDNNRKQFSGLKPIKSIIDDYDLMQCGLSNNLQDFDTPIYVVSNFQGQTDDALDEMFQNVRAKKLVGVTDNGGIDIKTIDVPYQARKVKADEDEKNIYRFGFGLNTLGLRDTAATTNIAIKAAYSLLDMKANKMIVRLKKLLKDIIKVVVDEINDKNGTDYQASDVKIQFEPQILMNEAENAQIKLTKAQTKQVELTSILNIAAVVGDEQALRAICEVMDFDFEELKSILDKKKEEQKLLEAQTTLNTVVPEDDDAV